MFIKPGNHEVGLMDCEYYTTRGSLALAETVREGLDCLAALLQDEEYLDSADVLEEAVQGIAAIEGLIYPRFPGQSRSLMAGYSLKLHQAAAAALSCLAMGQWEQLEETCVQALLPCFEAWLNELYRLSALHLYC